MTLVGLSNTRIDLTRPCDVLGSERRPRSSCAVRSRYTRNEGETLKRYDPNRTPDPAWWLSLDESERIDLARSSQRPDEDLPSPRLHATIHVIVENQVALGSETPAAETLDRLLAEGLERHDAIHAIGSVLASFAYRAIQPAAADDAGEVDLQESFWHDLAGLSAQSWRRDR